MELKPAEIACIAGYVVTGVDLQTILETQYPQATIYVRRGCDRFDYTRYTHGAYFSMDDANKDIPGIPPNGMPTSSYHIVSGTIADLVAGKIKDQGSGLPLDETDITMVYHSLQERFHYPAVFY